MKTNKLKIYRDQVGRYAFHRKHGNGRIKLQDTYKLFLFRFNISCSPYEDSTKKYHKTDFWLGWFEKYFSDLLVDIQKNKELIFEEEMLYSCFSESYICVYLTSKNYEKLRRVRDKFKDQLKILHAVKIDSGSIKYKSMCEYFFNKNDENLAMVNKLFPHSVKITDFSFACGLYNNSVFRNPVCVDITNKKFSFYSKETMDMFLLHAILSHDTGLEYSCIDRVESNHTGV